HRLGAVLAAGGDAASGVRRLSGDVRRRGDVVHHRRPGLPAARALPRRADASRAGVLTAVRRRCDVAPLHRTVCPTEGGDGPPQARERRKMAVSAPTKTVSYIDQLNRIAMAETNAGCYLAAWADVTPDPELAATLRLVAARETSHGDVFRR